MTAPLTDAQRALVEEVAHYAAATVARKPLPPRMRQEREDMVGECYLALCRAAAAYDPERGKRWTTYAIACVRLVPTEYLRREDRLGRNQRDREDRRDAARLQLLLKLGRHPQSEELASVLGITEEQAEEWRTRCLLAAKWHDAAPLHQALKSSTDSRTRGGDTLEDRIPSDTPTPEQEIVRQDMVEQVRQAIERLPSEIKRTVARRVFLDEEMMKAVAVEVRRSESRVHQIVQEAREYLRRTLVPLVEEE